MKSQYVAELKVGQLVKEKFLLNRKNLKEKKDGGYFTQVELSDRTGTIDGVAWDNVSDELKNISAGTYVFVTGTVGEYNERPQIVVNSISRLGDNDIEIEDFLCVVEEDINMVMAEIKEAVDRIQNTFLKELLNQLFNDATFVEKFRKTPAAKKAHQAAIGGLAVHTRNIMRLVMKVCSVFDTMDIDLLIAGSLLHDIGKIFEYSYQKRIDITTEGRMLGHIVMGYEFISQKISKIKNFPNELRLKLLHMIVSHHGELDYGSPILPMFPEALVLHFMDNLEAKLEMMYTAIKQNQSSDSEWTEYHQLLQRYIYLGTEI